MLTHVVSVWDAIVLQLWQAVANLPGGMSTQVSQKRLGRVSLFPASVIDMLHTTLKGRVLR